MTTAPTSGPGRRTLRRQTRRATLACVVVLALSAGLAVAALASGRYATPLHDLWPALTGGGDPGLRFVLFELRLPRIGTALAVGAALGAAGALFQSASRNPLGSPDIVGFTVGAATGALVVLLVLHDTRLTPAVGAVLGGATVAAAALLLGGTGQRLILVGIGLSALLTSVNAYLLTRAEVTDAQNAAVWLVGSLNGSGHHLPLLLGALAALLPLSVLAARGLRLIENGGDKALSLGVPVRRQRLTATALAVALTAVGVAGAGPVGFVALAAPHLARRLTRVAAPLVTTSAALGAALLLAADQLAQRLVPGQQLPVGAVTGVLGGGYLALVLAWTWRGRPR
ncbi:iron complex transport system permease protein [Micromonospora haikouensis]|uniref:Iron complex transport system permease protein n=1 Tax=Micromonospora haikouensis TaxID=686309 RepID=A0A1C4W1U8_9ACTN|nr:iron chelate uptake ABC transporter family permease subunit [Micromonospora haikouensis]SCE90213.1 iron complex transport system permease protein [Micromonospora haikouensis]